MRVFEEGAYADRAFAGEASALDERDHALAQRLAYGATQRVRTLDHAIAGIGGREVAQLDVPVRAALRLGAYELAFMDAIPPRATVNEAVELVRATGARPTRSGRSCRRCRRRRRRKPRSSTPTPTGSQRRGGASGARTTPSR